MACASHVNMDGVTPSHIKILGDGHHLCKECDPIHIAPKLLNDGASKHIPSIISCLLNCEIYMYDARGDIY